MPVEILILSGARQDERIVLDADEFRIGDDSQCDVFFDPGADESVLGRNVLFRLEPDGWFIARIGTGEVLLNYDPVNEKTHVRSGDLVRMSQEGPDFSFTVLTKAQAASLQQAEPTSVALAGSASDAPASPATKPPPIPSGPPAGPAIQAAADSTAESAAIPAATAPAVESTAIPAAVPAAEANSAPAPAASPAVAWPVWIGGGLAICAVALLVAWAINAGNRQIVINIEQQSGGTGTEQVQGSRDASKGTENGTDESSTGKNQHRAGGGSEGDSDDDSADKDPWAAAFEQVDDSVFLIQLEVEKGDGSFCWPHATACAVHENTLLTSASAAAYVAAWLDQGWRVVATNRYWTAKGAGTIEAEITDARIHVGFATLCRKFQDSDDPKELSYFDVGILATDGRLPKIATLASPEELAALDEGVRVAFVGISHEGEKIGRAEKDNLPKPESARGKIYLTASIEEPRGRRLEVKGAVPAKAIGSPLINDKGHVVGLYATSAPPQDGVDLNIHYAHMVERWLIDRWLQKRDTELWMRPVMKKAESDAAEDPPNSEQVR